jgi:hypothetical protein
VPAIVVLAGGTVLRDAPDGDIVGFLPERAPVQVLYRSELVGEVLWLEVRDVLNRTGWVRATHLALSRR